MGDVIDLDDYRPHIIIDCGKNVHVLPMAVIEDVMKGRRCITELDDWEEIVRFIFAEFMRMLEEA